MQNIIFLPLEKVFQNKPVLCEKLIPKSWKKVFFQKSWKKNSGFKKRGKRSFINWNEHRETKKERIGTKTVLRVKNY